MGFWKLEPAFLDDYYWLTWAGCIVAFIMAFGIGANDVANTFGTSVGAKSLKLWQAVLIGAIAEFTGCIFMGKNVTSTVRKGIVSHEAFEEQPQILMVGMFAALCGAGSWLIIATKIGMPVSTTHSIIGAVLGFGLCWKDAADTIAWATVTKVVISWVAAPVFSGIFAAFAYALTRWAILRRENSYKKALIFYPVFLFVMFFIMAMFVIVKGGARYKLSKVSIGVSIAYSLAISAGLSLVSYFTVFKLIVKPRIDAMDEKDLKTKFSVNVKEAPEHSLSVDINDIETTKKEDVTPEDPNEKYQDMNFICRWWHMYLNPANMDEKVHAQIEKKSGQVHLDAEIYPPKTEEVFTGVQIATATFDSFAHGANDTANAMGPLAAIIGVYTLGGVTGKKTDTPLWIIFFMGFSLCIGLALWGWRVIRQIGVKLVKVTPSRGYTMELASALSVIIASKMGIPVSTTHCQVGAEIGVGLVDGGKQPCKAVNWSLFCQIFAGWVLTLIFAAGVTALLFSFMVYSPHVINFQAMQSENLIGQAGTENAGMFQTWVYTDADTEDDNDIDTVVSFTQLVGNDFPAGTVETTEFAFRPLDEEPIFLDAEGNETFVNTGTIKDCGDGVQCTGINWTSVAAHSRLKYEAKEYAKYIDEE